MAVAGAVTNDWLVCMMFSLAAIVNLIAINVEEKLKDKKDE